MPSLRLLGPVSLRDDSGAELHRLLGQPKRFAVLAYLAGRGAGVYHRRDRLLGLFWPESTTQQARHGLRQVLYELRKHLGEEALLKRGTEEIALNPEVVTCDVSTFETSIDAAELAAAVEAYQGPLLDAFHLSGAPEFTDWMEARRNELHRSAVAAHWSLVDQRLEEDGPAAALAPARAAVALAPTDEVGVRRLMELHASLDNTGDALRVYERLAQRLGDEFEVEPSAETQALVERVRSAGVQRRRDRQGEADETRSAASGGSGPSGDTAETSEGMASAGTELSDRAIDDSDRAIDDVPDTGESLTERTPHPRRNARARRLAQGAIAAAALGAVILFSLNALPDSTLIGTGSLEAGDRVLLVDLTNLTSDSTLARTITELLRIDLSQSRVVRLVDPDAVRGARRRMGLTPDAPLDELVAREVAEREGVKAVLTGDVATLGSAFVLSAKLISTADGTLLAAERVTAETENDLIEATNRLSSQLRGRIGEALGDVEASPPLERVTTGSLPALRAYSLAMGRAGLEDNQLAGVRLLREAVAYDSTFAMAHRALAIFMNRTGNPDQAIEPMRRAYQYRDRLPAVERHLVVALYHALVDYDAVATEEAYRAALAVDSTNVTALVNLGYHLSRVRRQHDQRERLALRSLDVRWTLVGFLNAVNAMALQGEFDEAEAFVEASRGELDPSFGLRLAVLRRDWAEADRWVDAEDQDLLLASNYFRLRGRLADSRRALATWQGRRESRNLSASASHRWLLEMALDHGPESEAERLLLEPLDEEAPIRVRGLLHRAELLAYAGRPDEARGLVAVYESEIDTAQLRLPAVRAERSRAQGEIAMAEGRPADAAAHFEVVYEEGADCTTCGLARLGDALIASGRPDSAMVVLERLIATPTTGLMADDARWMPGVHITLGDLYRERGREDDAVRHYDAFLRLWEGADAQFQPTVAEVAARR